jgi:hypothetical protein
MTLQIRHGSIVVLHLMNPSEKLWGVLEEIAGHGIYLRALNVSSFEDWMAQALRDEAPTLGLATLYVPLFRVEKLYLDESVGHVESLQERFQRRVGMTVMEFLGLESLSETGELPS